MGVLGIDISGIPLFYVNKIISTKMDDGNVMVICGIKTGNEFTPLYATVSPAIVAMTAGREYLDAAQDAFNSTQMGAGAAH